MNNSSVAEIYTDPDPVSALFVGIWFASLAIVGIPLNLFIIISTLTLRELRSVPANAFIVSLALGDSLFLVGFFMHLPYALSESELVCKITAAILFTPGMVSISVPSFLAIHRYGVVCAQEQKLAWHVRRIFSRKGIYITILSVWIYQLSFNIPFIAYDTLGLVPVGTCGPLKHTSKNVPLIILYLTGAVGVVFGSNVVLFFFYNRVTSWVNEMSAGMELNPQTSDSVTETKNALQMAKWITIIPLIITSPSGLLEIILRFDENFMSIRLARCFVCLYPLCPVLNAFITVKFSSPYRLALKKLSEKTRLSSALFFWVFERQFNRQTDIVSEFSRHPGTTNPRIRVVPVV